MNATKMYELMSKKLLEADLTHQQRMEVRKIIADVLLESLDEDTDQNITDSVKIEHDIKYSLN